MPGVGGVKDSTHSLKDKRTPGFRELDRALENQKGIGTNLDFRVLGDLSGTYRQSKRLLHPTMDRNMGFISLSLLARANALPIRDQESRKGSVCARTALYACGNGCYFCAVRSVCGTGAATWRS